MKKHFEIIVLKNGAAVRKGVVAADIVEAINKAIQAVDGATVADVDRAVQTGVVDIV